MATTAPALTNALAEEYFRCSRCDIASAERTCFIIPDRYSKPPRDIRCITCEQRRLKSIAWRNVGGVLAVIFWPVVFLSASSNGVQGVYWASLLSGCLLYPFIIIVHELGHAFTAALLGLEVGAISIGYGAVIGRFEIACVPIRLHAWPIAGRVYLGAQSLRFLRTRVWITTLMGPMANAVVLVATVRWWNSLAVHLGPSIPALCIAINLIVILSNLVPYHTRVLGYRQRSDGLALLEIPRTPEQTLRAYLYSAGLIRSLFRFERGDFPGAERSLEGAFGRVSGDASLAIMKSACRVRVGDYTAARLALEPLLTRLSTEQPHVRAAVLNNMACALVMEDAEAGSGRKALEQADLFSAESFGMYPCVLAYRSTRAFVLSARGRFDEGLALLDYAHYRTATDQERSRQEIARAFALKEAGRVSEALQIAHEAARLDHTAVPVLVRLRLLSASSEPG